MKQKDKETCMVQNILDYLEHSAASCPDKTAFEDLENSYELPEKTVIIKEREIFSEAVLKRILRQAGKDT